MVVYGCGINTSNQICNASTQILCCPTLVSAIKETSAVQVAFSHILWKTESCWKMTGFKGSNASLDDSIHPQWKVSMSENRTAALKECGSIVLWEKGSWRPICFQNYSEEVKDHDLHTKAIGKDKSEIKDCDGSHDMCGDKDERVSEQNYGCAVATSSSAPDSLHYNLIFDRLCVEDNSLLVVDKDGVVYNGNVPVPVGGQKITDIALGKEHYMALTDGGSVLTWGNGMRGQLGNGEMCQTDGPMPVEFLQGLNITSISCGGWHSAALSDAGDVYIWGWNESGQLGFASKTQNEDLLYGGFDHSCQCPFPLHCKVSQTLNNTKSKTLDILSSSEDSLDTENKNYISGAVAEASSDKRINHNRTKEIVNVQASPKLLDFWDENVSVTQVVCGDRHTLFFLDDGSVWSVGMNRYGQLGLGHTKFQSEPAEVPIKNITHIYAGGWNSIFITDD